MKTAILKEVDINMFFNLFEWVCKCVPVYLVNGQARQNETEMDLARR